MSVTLIIIKETYTKEYRGLNPDHCHIVIYDNYNLNFWMKTMTNFILPIIRTNQNNIILNNITFSCNNIQIFKSMLYQLYYPDLLDIDHLIEFEILNREIYLKMEQIYSNQIEILFEFYLFKNQ